MFWGGNTMNIAIIEDETNVQNIIKEYLSKYFINVSTNAVFEVYHSGEDFFKRATSEFDIILLDIQMPGINGIEIAHKIRTSDNQVIIIFITSLIQYALMGYKVQALDYIIKPISYKTLSFTLDRALHIIEKRPAEKSVLVNSNGTSVKVAVSEITYFEVQKHRFFMHTIEKTYNFAARSMKELEAIYADNNFTKCNNCYLVNLAHVKSIKKDIVTVGNEELVISRPRKKDFIAAVTNYIENT